MRQLKIDPKQCIGCRSCEVACALENEDSMALNRSRIAILRFDESREFGLPCNQIFICRQCQDAPCLVVCPEDAIEQENSTGGIIRVETEKCTGCGLCLKACPFGAIRIESVSKKAFKCELCSGEPACVDMCPTDAITFIDQELFFAKNIALQMRGVSILKNKEECQYHSGLRINGYLRIGSASTLASLVFGKNPILFSWESAYRYDICLVGLSALRYWVSDGMGSD